ncbi:hypothetical protein [Clostridium intestinale]|uniref:Uncharacterized protein n=1 Tax=Clostridium intestinale URNW TaxID=1294142 RepID=U2NS21_9CLOT|nr:hypothetical protein [Clostridium intestinale]ERK31651.1 hypothetical protein CINTURNW_1044 [Clostridium intestinale URNW]
MNQLVIELNNGTRIETPRTNNINGLESLVSTINRLKETNGQYMISDENGSFPINANDIVSVRILF